MKENRAVGPNLKTYFYYTNEMADREDAKGIIIIATGIEATGSVYDEVGDYLDKLGYAMYVIDEWGYGKTGALVKQTNLNWKKKDFYYASYNIHALSVLAKHKHPNIPLYLIGNDFGAMLSFNVLKEFPEVVDKMVTIGWGAPRGQDFGFLFVSWLKKVLLYDNGKAKLAHKSKNKRFALRFEKGEKYAWLSSDLAQVKKIRDAGYIDEPGTIGHYYHYFLNKVKVPCFNKIKKIDRKTPILLLSGKEDLFTKKGLTTKALGKYLQLRKFENVETMIVDGRHELLFETNRFDVVDKMIAWLTGEEVVKQEMKETITEIVVVKEEPEIVEAEVVEPVIETIEETKDVVQESTKEVVEFMEAEEDLLINTNKESK